MILIKRVKIGVLTSSRADYGVYKNLLKLLFDHKNIDLSIIAFGMHLQKHHGETIKEIISDNYFDNLFKVSGMPFDDSKLDISKGYGKLVKSFSKFWDKNIFDLVFALGDRFEMSAAVQAGLPFELKFAHIHGGEISLGSLDNIYRDQISLASQLHFTSTSEASKRLKKLLISKNFIYNVGSLSIDNLDINKLPQWESVCDSFKIPNKPFVLITFHPETVGTDKNEFYVKILHKSLTRLSKLVHLVITQVNADNSGNLYRQMNLRLHKENSKSISLVNSFGKKNYFSAIKNSIFLLGNTSSGIIEAASFGKYVLNIGERQRGRTRSKNIIDVDFDEKEILKNSKLLLSRSKYRGGNNYAKKNTSENILSCTLNFLK